MEATLSRRFRGEGHHPWAVAAIVTAVQLAASSSAHAVTYRCDAELVLGYSGVVLDDWRTNAGGSGQVSFGLDTETGVYSEVMHGSAGVLADRTLEIRRGQEVGSEVTIGLDRMMVVKIDDSVHGVNYVRLDEEGLAEIGTCTKK
jgi:hypothetical protein